MALELGIKLTANTSGFTGAINSASKALSDTLAKSLSQAKVSLDQLDPAIQQAVQGIDLMNFDQVSAAMQQFTQDGQLMASFLEQLKADLGSVDDQEAFTELSTVIAQAEAQLKTLSATENQNTTSAKSLKAQLREMTAELARMEVAGLRGTDAYNQLSAEAGRVKDAINDASDSIKTLASDTRTLDAGVDIANGLVGAFQAYQGVLALTGSENEDASRSLQKLMAIMAIAQGIQQTGTLLTGQSAGVKAIDTALTYAQSVAYRVLGISATAAAAGVTAAQRAMATTVVGAFLVAIGILVEVLIDFYDASDEAAAATKRLNQELETSKSLMELNASTIERTSKEYVSYLKLAGASEVEIYAAQQRARQEDVNNRKDYLKKLKQAEDNAQKNGTNEEYKKASEERLKYEEETKNKESQIIIARNEFAVKLREEEAKKIKEHNEKIKKQGEERVKIEKENKKKLEEELQRNIQQNLNTEIENARKVIDERNKLGRDFSKEESQRFRQSQADLFLLEKKRIDDSYQAEREKILKLGPESSKLVQDNLKQLKVQYDNANLKLKVEFGYDQSIEKIVDPEKLGKTILYKVKFDVDTKSLENGVLKQFGSQKFDNSNFISGLGEAIKASVPADIAEIKNRDKLITDQLEQSRATIESGLEDSIAGAADAIGSVLAQGGGIGNALAAAGQVILKTIGGVFQALGKQLIAAAITVKALKESLKTLFANPIGALVVGVGLVALGGILKNIKLLQATPFAEGGIVTGPRLGLVGEAGKEAIIPLDRIGEVLGSIGGSQNVFVTGQLSGETIYLQQQRVSQRRGRFV